MAGMAVKMAATKLGVPEALQTRLKTLLNESLKRLWYSNRLIRSSKTASEKWRLISKHLRQRLRTARTRRAKFSGDITPKVFCILALILYSAYVMAVTIMPHDQNDETIISLVLGQLSGILGTCAAFFYGGSPEVKDMEKLVAMLKRHEGEVVTNGRHLAYKCPEGYWTLGIGRNVDQKTASGCLTKKLISCLRTI